MNRVIVYTTTAANPGEFPPANGPSGDRLRAPNALAPRAASAPDAVDPLVAALGDQLLAAWLAENASRLLPTLLTPASEPANTPGPKSNSSEART